MVARGLGAGDHQLFGQTQRKLALWYAGVMGGILGLAGLGIYEGVLHAHQMTLDQEVRAVAGTLHTALEPLLQEPGEVPMAARRLLPDFCDREQDCPSSSSNFPLAQGSYYAILHGPSGAITATSGREPDIPWHGDTGKSWLTDDQGERFYQVAIALKTRGGEPWGVLYVGRTVLDWDNYLALVQWSCLAGVVLGWVIVGGASWWLAGLAMKPVRRSYGQIQQFTADAAHELRTPLAAMAATLETERSPQNAPQNSPLLDRLHSQTQRLITLVQNLLWLAKADQDQLPVQQEPCILEEIASDTLDELSALARQAQVQLKLNAPNSLTIPGNEPQLYQLFANLISNGIQYTPPHGQVTVTLEKRDRHAQITISDTGIGIPSDQRSRIFDRFYRVASDRSRPGSGLGLAIVAAIVQLHGGTVQCQGREGGGSVFVVRLPLARGPKKIE